MEDRTMVGMSQTNRERVRAIPRSVLGRLQPRNHLKIEAPILVCRFGKVPGAEHMLALANEVGHVMLMDCGEAAEKCSGQLAVKVIRAHSNAIFDLAWLSPNRVLTASGDQSVALWDVTCGSRLDNFLWHRCSVRSISVCPENSNMFVSGSRDGCIAVWDIRDDRRASRGGRQLRHPSQVYYEAHSSDSSISTPKRSVARGALDTRKKAAKKEVALAAGITCVLYQSNSRFVSTAATSNVVKIWDIRQKGQSQVLPYPGATRLCSFGAICSDQRYRDSVYAACTDNSIYEFSLVANRVKPISRLVGAKLRSFYISTALSPCGSYLLSGSSESGRAFVWPTRQPTRSYQHPLCYVESSQLDQGELAAVDWSTGQLDMLATCDDHNLILWTSNDADTAQDERLPKGACRMVPSRNTRSDTLTLSPSKARPGTPFTSVQSPGLLPSVRSPGPSTSRPTPTTYVVSSAVRNMGMTSPQHATQSSDHLVSPTNQHHCLPRSPANHRSSLISPTVNLPSFKRPFNTHFLSSPSRKRRLSISGESPSSAAGCISPSGQRSAIGSPANQRLSLGSLANQRKPPSSPSRRPCLRGDRRLRSTLHDYFVSLRSDRA